VELRPAGVAKRGEVVVVETSEVLSREQKLTIRQQLEVEFQRTGVRFVLLAEPCLSVARIGGSGIALDAELIGIGGTD